MLRMTQGVHDGIVTHARQEFPAEVCGILGGYHGIITEAHRVRNMKSEPDLFLMDPREQIDAMRILGERGMELLAFYHSHPRGPAVPSGEDIRLAFYPEVVTLIVSLADPDRPVLRAFQIRDGESSEERLDVVPDSEGALILH